MKKSHTSAMAEKQACDAAELAAAALGKETVRYTYSQVGVRGDLAFTILKTVEPLIFGAKEQDPEKRIEGHVPAACFKNLVGELAQSIFKQGVEVVRFQGGDDKVDPRFASYFRMIALHDLWAVSKKATYLGLCGKCQDAIAEKERNLLIEFVVKYWRCLFEADAVVPEDSNEPASFLLRLVCDEVAVRGSADDDFVEFEQRDTIYEFLRLVRDKLLADKQTDAVVKWSEFVLDYCRRISNQELDQLLENPSEEAKRFMGLIGLKLVDHRSPLAQHLVKYCVPQDPTLENIGTLVQRYPEMAAEIKRQQEEILELKAKLENVRVAALSTTSWIIKQKEENLLDSEVCSDMVVSGNPFDAKYQDVLKRKEICKCDGKGCYWSKDQLSSYLEFDFVSRRVSLTGVKIARTAMPADGPHMKEWEISGRNALNEEWTQIYLASEPIEKYDPNQPIMAVGIHKENGPFRYIRLTQVGPNAAGSYHLCIAGIELSGNVYQSCDSLAYNPARRLDGIVCYLTKKHGANVHQSGVVNVTASSTSGRDSNPMHLTESEQFWTFSSNNAPESWVCYDFRALRVIPTSYSIRSSGAGQGGPHPKSWVLEVSEDGYNWTVFDSRQDNNDLNGPYLVQNFTIEGQPKRCRYVRLKQTGKNHAGTDQLTISAFEIFGSIVSDAV